MTLKEAAAKAGVKPVTLRAAISRGRLKAEKFGPMWLVADEALENWQKNEKHKPGPARNA